MAHRIECLIYKKDHDNQLLRALKTARYVTLNYGFVAVPLNEELLEEFRLLQPHSQAPQPILWGNIEPDPVPASFLEAVSRDHSIAYVRTRYFGGEGEQAAGVWENGRLVMAPLVDTRPGPINAALSKIGVPRDPKQIDEFASLGLQQYRGLGDLKGTACT
jgi:hypothetical protein